MNRIGIANVRAGWFVRHKGGGVPKYVVLGNYGNRLTAVRAVDVTNPSEWHAINPDTGEVFEIIGDPTLGPGSAPFDALLEHALEVLREERDPTDANTATDLAAAVKKALT